MERFIRNGNFFDKEINNGKFVIKMFLIKDQLKIRKIIIYLILIMEIYLNEFVIKMFLIKVK